MGQIKFLDRGDPFALLIKGAKELWPHISADIQFAPPDHLDNCVGMTTFPDDGSIPLIDISCDIPVYAALEILAHEIAHVVEPEDEHGEKWERAFHALYEHFNAEPPELSEGLRECR